jgi:two-component system NtrC family sensor kinase
MDIPGALGAFSAKNPGARRREYSLSSKVLLFSISIYIVLTSAILVAWNVGAPRFGIPGRVSELLDLEKDYLGSSIEHKLAQLETWLSTRQSEAQGIARIDSPNPEIGALAAVRSPDPALAAIRRDLEVRYESICNSATPTARILVLRSGDGLVLADSSRLAAGSVFPIAKARREADSGQFRDSGEIYSFCAARASNGIPILFVLVAPLAALLDELRDNRFDLAKGLGFALVDARGRLISPLSMPDLKSRLSPGVFLAGKAKLDEMAAGDEPIVLQLGLEPLSAEAAKISISTYDEIFMVVLMSRNRTIRRIASDSAAMALFALLMAAAASLLTLRYIKVILSPLIRLHTAVDAFGRSEPFALPEGATGEVGEITRAFSALAKRIGEWKSDLEAEVELRTSMLKLTAELCGIYARDSSETATVAAVNILKDSFKADAAALFYVNAEREYRYCLAGTDYPIALPEERWRELVKPLSGEGEIARFGPWSPPGLGRRSILPSWMSCRLYSQKSEGGYIFLGRAEGGWSEGEEEELVAVVKTIAPIVQVRRERQIEEKVRQKAEEMLAGNERRLRTFLEGSRDMIYTADSGDIITGINAAGLALLGRSSKSEVIGRSFASFALNPEDREQLLRKVREVGYAADYESVLKRGDGNRVFCLETAYAIRDPAGGVVELQGIVKDITERISSESALWKTNLELADANLKIKRTQTLMIQHEKLASIGQLAAGVAHEINNPLGFLKSNHVMLEKYLRKIRLAWEERDASPQAEIAESERKKKIGNLFSLIDTVFAESNDGFARIMQIVGNLKIFSRVEKGGDFELFDVNAGIESTLAVARNEIKYVADVNKSYGELPPILARGSEINQVILNILVNAAQAIEGQKRQEKGLIEIRTIAMGDHVVIGIRDDGPGIPESIRMKIFDPFFTTKEPGKGTGLGLSISYDIIVSKHGGHLGVDSIPGGGTTFTIELPIAGLQPAAG